MTLLSNILKISIFTIFFLSNIFAQIDGATAHMVEALPKKEIGKELYNKYCISCHHENRLGVNGVSILPSNLEKYIEKDLVQKIKNGFPQTLMPKYDFLSLYELHQIARYLNLHYKTKEKNENYTSNFCFSFKLKCSNFSNSK